MKRHIIAIAYLRREIKNGERALREMPQYAAQYPVETKIDTLMWESLLPALREALAVLEGPKRVMHLEDL